MPTYSTPQYGGKKKAAKKDKSVGGFIANAGHGIRDALTGIVTAPYYIGKAAYHDLGYGDAKAGSELYAMGSGIAKSIADYYKPLVKGDFEKFGQNVYDQPVQLGLDVATLFTGGGAAAGKAGSLAAKAGEASSLGRAGAKVAGLKYTTPAQLGITAAEASARGGKRIADDSWVMPKTYDIKLTTGTKPHSIDLPRNPVSRGRVQIKEYVYKQVSKGSKPGSGRGYFHPDKRGVKLAETRRLRIERTQIMRATQAAENAVLGLSKPQRTALFYRLKGFQDADDLAALMSQRAAAKFEHESALVSRKKGTPEYDNALLKKLHVEEDARRLSDPDVVRYIEGGHADADMVKAEAALRKADAAVQKYRRDRNPDETVEQQANRAWQPRREVGLPDDPAKQPIVVSMSANRKIARKLKASSKKKVVPAGYGSDKVSTGSAFRNALYTPDALKITEQLRQELTHKGAVENVAMRKRLMVPLDPIRHEGGLADGSLTKLTKEGAVAKEIEKQAATLLEFVRNLKTSSKKGDDLVEAAIEGIEELSDDIARAEQVFVIPTRALDELTTQLATAQSLVGQLLSVPVKAWRDFVLSLKGTFYVNNWLGNLLLGIVAYGPVTYTKALIEAGSKKLKAGRQIDEADPSIARSGFARTVAKDSEAAHGDLLPGGYKNPLNLTHALAQIFASKGALFTEDNFRRAAAKVELQRTLKDHMKNTGLSKADAADDLLNDADAVDAMFQRAYANLLDYSKLTPVERDKIRPLMPFWAFTRSIIGRTVRLAEDEPWKLVVLEHMSNTALDENEELLGELPEYLRGVAVTGKLKDGKVRGISTYGMNPFSGVADQAAQVASVFTDDPGLSEQNPLSSLNPYIKSGLEAVIGQDLFLGRELAGPRGNVYAKQLAMNFPQYAMREKYNNPGISPYLERDLKDTAISYGVSTGQINMRNVRRNLAIQQYFARRDEASRRRQLARQEAAAVAAGRR